MLYGFLLVCLTYSVWEYEFTNVDPRLDVGGPGLANLGMTLRVAMTRTTGEANLNTLYVAAVGGCVVVTKELTVTEPGIYSLTVDNNFVVGDYQICYTTVDVATAVNIPTTFRTVAANPASATVASLRAGRSSGITILSEMTQNLGDQSTTDPKMQFCGNTLIECGQLLEHAANCVQDLALNPSILWEHPTVWSTAIPTTAVYSSTLRIGSEGFYRMCYNKFSIVSTVRINSWHEVPQHLQVLPSNPTSITTIQPPRIRDAMAVVVQGDYQTETIESVFIVSWGSGQPTCSEAAIQSEITSPGVTNTALTEYTISIRIIDDSATSVAVCVRLSGGQISRVAYRGDGTSPMTLLPANPANAQFTPTVPRVQQFISITLMDAAGVAVPLSGTEEIWFERNGACLNAAAELFPSNVISTVVINSVQNTAEVRFSDIPGQGLGTTSHRFVLCYKSDASGVTKKVRTSVSVIAAAAPASYTILNNVIAMARQNFVISFNSFADDVTLDLSVDSIAFVNTADQTVCNGENHATDVTIETASVTSRSILFQTAGCYLVCYRLNSASSPGSWASVIASASAQPQNCGGSTNSIFVFQTNPASYNPQQESTFNTVFYAQMTFAISFSPVLSSPAPPAQTDEDEFRVIRLLAADITQSLTRIQYDGICRDPTTTRWSLSMNVFLLVDRTQALLRLNPSSYLVCYKPRDYSSFISLPNEAGTFPMEIVASPLAYQGTIPDPVRSRQTVFIEATYTSTSTDTLQLIAASNNTVWMYAERSPYCTDVGSDLCRCPDGATEHLSAVKSPSDNRREVIQGQVLQTSWLVKWSDVEPGNYIVCFNTSSPVMLGSFPVAAAYPEYTFVGTTTAPRQGQSVVLFFFQSVPVPMGSTEILNDIVDVLEGSQCDCSIDRTCPLQGSYSVSVNAARSLGQIVITEGLLSSTYTICYLQESGSNARTNVLVQVPGDVTFTESLQVSPADPSNAQLQPGVPRANEIITVTLTMVSPDFVVGDQLRVVQGSCHVATPAVEIIATHLNQNRYTIEVAEGNQYKLCHTRNGVAAAIPNPDPLVINRRFPQGIVVEPSSPSVNQSITITVDCSNPGDSAVVPECTANDIAVITTNPDLCTSTQIPFSDTPMTGEAGVLSYFADLEVYYGNFVSIDSSGASPVSVLRINQILAAGDYTLCYNWRANAATSSVQGVFTKVGTFTVGTLNPSSVEITPSNPTYGELGVVFKFDGVGLAVTDTIRFSPTGTPCFGVPSSNTNNNLTLTSPTTLEWTLSQTYYDTAVAQMGLSPPVELQICYLLTGATWANVGNFVLNPQQPRSIEPLPVDGPRDSFGRHVVRQFVNLRIRFDNQERSLSLNDVVKITTGASCDQPSTVVEGTDYVLEAGLRIPIQCDFCTEVVIQFLTVSEFSVCYQRVSRGFTLLGSIRVKTATASATTPDVLLTPYWSSFEYFKVLLSGITLTSLDTDRIYLVNSAESCFVTTQQTILLTSADDTSGEMTVPYVDQAVSYKLCVSYQTPTYSYEISVPSFVVVFNPPEPSWFYYKLGFPDSDGFPHEFILGNFYGGSSEYSLALSTEVNCASDGNDFGIGEVVRNAIQVSHVNYSTFISHTLCIQKNRSAVVGTPAITPKGVPSLLRYTFTADTIFRDDGQVGGVVSDGSGLLRTNISEVLNNNLVTGVSAINQQPTSYIILSSSLSTTVGLLPSVGYTFTLWTRFPSLASAVDLIEIRAPFLLKISIPFPTQSVSIVYQSVTTEIALLSANFIIQNEWVFIAVQLTVETANSITTRRLRMYANNVIVVDISLSDLNGVAIGQPQSPGSEVLIGSAGCEAADIRIFDEIVAISDLQNLRRFYAVNIPGSLSVTNSFPRLGNFQIPDVLRTHSSLSILLNITRTSPADVGFLIPQSTSYDSCANAGEDLISNGFITNSMFTINRLPSPGTYTLCCRRQVDQFAFPVLAASDEMFIELTVLPANPLSVIANQGNISYCGERLELEFTTTPMDVVLDNRDDICIVDASVGCNSLTDPTDACTTFRDSRLRSPYTPGRYVFCYRRSAGHALTGIWFPLSEIDISIQNPTSYLIFPENPHAGRRGYEIRQITFNDATMLFVDTTYHLILLQGDPSTYSTDPCMSLESITANSVTVDVTSANWQNPTFAATIPLTPRVAGVHTLCFRVNDRSVWGSLSATVNFNNSDPSSFVTVPPSPIAAGSRLEISVVFTDMRLSTNSRTLLMNNAGGNQDCTDLTNPVSVSDVIPHVINSTVQGEYVLCWVAGDGTVAAVAPGSLSVGQSNPSQFTIISGSLNSAIEIQFTGVGLTGGTAKIIPFGDSCSDNTGTTNARSTNTDPNIFNAMWDPVTAVRGKYTICFMLASSVWTMTPPGTPFIIGENPQSVEIVSPERFIEGGIELIQLRFSGYALGMSDEIQIISGQQADCGGTTERVQLTLRTVSDDGTVSEVDGCGSTLSNGVHTICYRAAGSTDADFIQLITVLPPENQILRFEQSTTASNPYRLNEIIALQFSNPIDVSQLFVVASANCLSPKITNVFNTRVSSANVIDITFTAVGTYSIVFNDQILNSNLIIQIVDLGPSAVSPTTFNFGAEIPLPSLNIADRPGSDIEYSIGLSSSEWCFDIVSVGSLTAPLLLYNRVIANESYSVCYMRVGGGRIPLNEVLIDFSPITLLEPCPSSGRAAITANVTVEVQGLIFQRFFAVPSNSVSCSSSTNAIEGLVLNENSYYGIIFSSITDITTSFIFCAISNGNTYQLTASFGTTPYQLYQGVSGAQIPTVAVRPLSGVPTIPDQNNFNTIQKGLFNAQVLLFTPTDEAVSTAVSLYFGNDPLLCREDCFIYRNGQVQTDINTNLRSDTEAAVFFNTQRGDPSRQVVWLSSPAGDAPLPDTVRIGFYTICVKTPSVDTLAYAGVVEVVETNPSGYVTFPANVRAGQILTMANTLTSTPDRTIDVLSTEPYESILIPSTLNFCTLASRSHQDALIPRANAVLAQSGRFEFILPARDSDVTYLNCFKDRFGNWYQVGNPLSVSMSDPTAVVLSPESPMNGVLTSITSVIGTSIGGGDQIIIIRGSSVGCYPDFGTSITPACDECSARSSQFDTFPTLSNLKLTTGTYSVCYQLSGGTLSFISGSTFEVSVGNPSRFDIIPAVDVITSGQVIQIQLSLEDVPSDIGINDEIKITEIGDCQSTPVLQNLLWNTSVFTVDSQTIRLDMILPYESVQTMYQICYFNSTVDSWVTVPPFADLSNSYLTVVAPLIPSTGLQPLPGRASVENLVLNIETQFVFFLDNVTVISAPRPDQISSPCIDLSNRDLSYDRLLDSVNSNSWVVNDDSTLISIESTGFTQQYDSTYVCYYNSSIGSYFDVRMNLQGDLLQVHPPRPSSHEIVQNVPFRAGQLLTVTVTGGSDGALNDIYSSSDLIIASTVACRTLTNSDSQISGSLVPSGDGGSAGLLIRSAGELQICFLTSLGAASTLQSQTVNEANPSGYGTLPQRIYAGQLVNISFTQGPGTTLSEGDSIKLIDSSPGSVTCWSNHPTVFSGEIDSDLRYQFTTPTTATQLLLCYRLQGTDEDWSQFDEVITVNPPHPSSFIIFPSVPRVGQKVSLTVTGTDGELSQQNEAFLILSNETCSNRSTDVVLPVLRPSNSIPEIQQQISITTQGQYSSFSSSHSVGVSVCYKLNAVGASYVQIPQPDLFIVLGEHPSSWSVVGDTLLGEELQLFFQSNPTEPDLPIGGAIKLINSATHNGLFCDASAAAGVAVTLGNLPDRSSQFIVEGSVQQRFHVCYMLPQSSWSLIPIELIVSNQLIRCASSLDTSATKSVLESPRLGQQIILNLFPFGIVNASADIGDELRFFEYSSGMDCGQTPSVGFTTNRISDTSLEWQVYLSSREVIDVRVCWLDIQRGVWVPLCFGCETSPSLADSQCGFTVSEANPSRFVSAPSEVFSTQNFTLQFVGVNLTVGDYVGLQTFSPGVGCSPDSVMSATTVNESFSASFSGILPPGQYLICYGLTGEVLDQMSSLPELLTIKQFASCAIQPSTATNPPGSDIWTVPARRLSEALPYIGNTDVTLGTSSILGLSVSADCSNIIEELSYVNVSTFKISQYLSDQNASSTFYICLYPETTGWGRLCNITVQEYVAIAPCTAPDVVIAGQYIAINSNTAGVYQIAPANHRCGDNLDQAVYPWLESPVLVDPVDEGSFEVCFLGADSQPNSVAFATSICSFSVGKKTPVRTFIDDQCEFASVDHLISVEFDTNHALDIRPTENDTAAVTQTRCCSEACLNTGDISFFSVNVSGEFSSTLSPIQNWVAGVYYVCYQVSGQSWLYVDSFTVLEHNPSAVSLTPTSARAGQLLDVTIEGIGLKISDKLFISQSLNCANPQSETNVISVEGSTVAKAKMEFSQSGRWYACYELSDCSTPPIRGLELDVSAYHPAGCQLPAKSRVGYSVRIFINPLTGATTPLSSNDEIKFVYSNQSCSEDPSPGTNILNVNSATSGSTEVDTDMFLNIDNVLGIELHSSLSYNICYKINGELYAHAGGNCVLELHPRNPHRYITTPAAPEARKRFSIAFIGDDLREGDRMQLTTSTCTTLGDTDGTRLQVLNQTYSMTDSALWLASEEVTICYHSIAVAAWVAQPKKIFFSVSNPLNYTIVPNDFPAPLAGVGFRMIFHEAPETSEQTFSNLTMSDLLSVNSDRGEQHLFPPDRIANDGSSIFEIVLNLAETYRIRYIRYRQDTHLTEQILFFEDLQVFPNPYGIEIKSGVDTDPQDRAYNRITLTLKGKGLTPAAEGPFDTPILPLTEYDQITIVDGGVDCPAVSESPSNSQNVEFQSFLYAAENGASQMDVLFKSPGRYKACYKRRTLQDWVTTPFYTSGCTLNDGCDIMIRNAHFPDWESPKKGNTISTLEGFDVTLTYNYSSWKENAFVSVIQSTDNCANRSITEFGNLGFLITQSNPTVSFTVRVNSTGTFKFCYHDPQFVATLQSTFVISEQLPNEIMVTGNPRVGGSIVTLLTYGNGVQLETNRRYISLATSAVIIKSAQNLYEDRISGRISSQQYQTAAMLLCNGVTSTTENEPWVMLLSSLSGEYRFSFPNNKTETAVVACGATDRFLAAIDISSGGMQGFTYNNNTKKLTVVGDGLTRFDQLSIAKANMGSCITGGLVSTTESSIQTVAENVNDAGTVAVFPIVLGAEDIQICYQMADQTSTAPLLNLESTSTTVVDTNTLQSTVSEPLSLLCTTAATSKVNEAFMAGRDSITVTALPNDVVISDNSNLTLAIISGPVDGLQFGTVTMTNSSSWIVTDLSAIRVGSYVVEIKLTTVRGMVLTTNCNAIDVLDVNPTAVPTEIPPTATIPTLVPVIVTNDDDCSNQFCVVHIIVIVCVVVLGLVVIVAIVLVPRRGGDEEINVNVGPAKSAFVSTTIRQPSPDYNENSWIKIQENANGELETVRYNTTLPPTLNDTNQEIPGSITDRNFNKRFTPQKGTVTTDNNTFTNLHMLGNYVEDEIHSVNKVSVEESESSSSSSSSDSTDSSQKVSKKSVSRSHKSSSSRRSKPTKKTTTELNTTSRSRSSAPASRSSAGKKSSRSSSRRKKASKEVRNEVKKPFSTPRKVTPPSEPLQIVEHPTTRKSTSSDTPKIVACPHQTEYVIYLC